MGPPKRKTPATETTATNDPVNDAPPPVRRSTRVSTRQLQDSENDKSIPPPSKKAKITNKKPEKNVSFVEKEVAETMAKKDETTMAVVNEVSEGEGPTVVIEHCKQCSRFKTRAIQVQKGLEEGVPGITVQINPEKPRRGCFEIRLKDGETFISLQDLKRPFKPMTDLVMEEVIADIVGKINA